MNLLDFLRALRRSIALVIATTVLGIAIGGMVALLTPQKFEASAQVIVSVRGQQTTTPGALAQASNYVQQVIETYRVLATSALVLEPVITQLGLDETPGQLAARTSARVATRSAVITLTVHDSSAVQVSRIANTLADSFATTVTEVLEDRGENAAYDIHVTMLQPATVPTAPIAPNPPLSLALGGALGLAAGIGIAVLRATLDSRIRSTSDLENALDVPVLGAIAFDKDAAAQPVVVASDPTHRRSEAFRSLRTNVRFLFPARGAAVFAITSSAPAEGKSTTAVNLAVAFAESGYKVALIDADLRKPRLADYLGIEGGVGLSDVLVGRIGVEDAIQRWGRGALFMLASGTVPPNPAELLGSSAMTSLVASLRTAFHVVIIDAPPILPVTDAAVLSRVTDGVLLVASAGSTKRSQLVEAAQRVEAGGGRIVGTVATHLPVSGADRAAYGEYGAPAAAAGK